MMQVVQYNFPEPGIAEQVRTNPIRRLIAGMVAVTFLLSPYGVLAAPVADSGAPVSKQPSVTQVNGVSVVQITAPNSSGISHNLYQSFDVPSTGVVLNNATSTTNTTLAGTISGNTNLGGRSASVILNEVTGSAASLLAGTLEVAGAPARVILANPNGITCDGCGFINTPHIQLTTGVPRYDGDNLLLDVTGGRISVTDRGLDVVAARLDLISRFISIQGQVRAGELNLHGGNVTINPETFERTKVAYSTDYDYVIDISQSLTAGTIRMFVSPGSIDPYGPVSDRGNVYNGIRSTASINAGQDVIVDAGGSISMATVNAGRDVQITSRETYGPTAVSNMLVGRNLSVNSDWIEVNQGGAWKVAGDVYITNPNSTGSFFAPLFYNYGNIEAGRDFKFQFSGAVNNFGVLKAGRDFDNRQGDPFVFNSGFLTNKPWHTDQAKIIAGRDMYLVLGETDGDIVAGNNIHLWGFNSVTGSGLVKAGNDLLIHSLYPVEYTYNGDLTSRREYANDVGYKGATLEATRDVRFELDTSLQQKGVINTSDIVAGRDIVGTIAGDFYNNQSLKAGNDIRLKADRFVNNGSLAAGNNVLASAGNSVGVFSDARGGETGYFFNTGNITAANNIQLLAGFTFTNSGSIAAGNGIRIDAESFTNTPSVDRVSGVAAGRRYSGCDGCSYVDEIFLHAGTMSALRDIVINAHNIDNYGGEIKAGNDIYLQGESVSNRKRVLLATWYSSGVKQTADLSTIDAVIQAGNHFIVSGYGGNGTNGSGDGSSSASQFVNTGRIGADTILVKADEVRNGYDPKADYYRKTVLPEGNPFSFDTAADGGQMLADTLLQVEGSHVLNTGYVGSGGVLAIQADSLENVKRNANYAEDRAVEGGTLIIRGDTVQAGGAMAASEWILDVGSVHSRSGDFLVVRDTDEATQSASEELVANLSTSLGANYTYEEAQNNLKTSFKKKKKKGWGSWAGVIIGFIVAYFTGGLASSLIADAVASGSTWAAGGLGNIVVSQGIGSFAGSVAGQYAATGEVNWQSALTAGLTSGITAGLTNAGVFNNGQSLNQLAGVNNVGGVVTNIASHNLDGFATNLLGMAGRGVVTAGVSTAINGGSFEKAFINSLVSDLGAVGANAVGQATDPLSIENILGHALVGCSVAAGQGKDCASGALGGVTGAVVNPLLGTFTEGSSTTERTLVHTITSMLASGALADALGLDGTTAVSAALNETLNNYLSPKGVDTIKKACAGAPDPTACQLRLAAEFNKNTAQQIANCRAQGNCKDLLNEVSTGFDAIKAAQADGTLTPAAAAILLEKQTRDMESLITAMGQPLPDRTALRTLVAVGLGGAAVLACLADAPGCAVLIYRVATSPTTVAVAEATLCTAAGALCPTSVAGLGAGVKTAAERLGVNLGNIEVTNSVAKTTIKVTSEINNSDVQILVNYAKSLGATNVEVNTGYIANEKLLDFLNRRVADGKLFLGGTVKPNSAGNGDFLIVF
jgi:filamentous hemagglutinin family protein